MIPKIIHWCWFSEKIPDKTLRYIDTWKKFMPSYEIVRWNADNFDIHSVKWVEQAIELKKYAFAADYIRLWAVYNYGGIYLDSDVEVLKPFDDLLNLPYFLGIENRYNDIEAATFGAEKNTFFLKDLLKFYKDRCFVKGEGEYDFTVLPIIMRHILEKKYGKRIKIFPSDYFSPKSYITEQITITKSTYSIHQFEGSWMSSKYSVYPKIRIFKNDAEIYIWGTGINGDSALRQCKENGWNVKGFLDSKAESGEYVFEGLACISPYQVLNRTERNFFIIVSTERYCREIYIILKKYGLQEGKDFWVPISGELLDY